MRWQCFALGLALGLVFWLLVWCVPALGGGTGLQGGQLGLQAGQLKRDAFDLRVAPLDRLGIGVDAFGLRGNMLTLLADLDQQLLCKRCQFARIQS